MPSPPRHIVILSEGAGFPNGMASSRRIQLLARGLVHHGHAVTVMVLRPFERIGAPLNTEAQGTFYGVDFEYPCGTTIRSAYFPTRRWNDLGGILGAGLQLWRMKRSHRLDAVILYSFNINLVRFYSALCRRLGAPLVQELCEWPLDQKAAHGSVVRGAETFCSRVFGSVDAVLPISARIEEICRRAPLRSGRDLPILRIPILVDSERFVANPATPTCDYIAYSGSLAYRNIIKIVLDACGELKRRGQQRTFTFSGRASESEIEHFHAEAERRGLADSVAYLGYLDDATLIQALQKAALLLVPLPDDPQSASRFPTRLGECLAVGRPVLTTAIGEAARWLRDGETAFLAPDCRPVSLADKIQQVMDNPALAATVATAGRKLAEREFNYIHHGQRLGAFLDQLIQSEKINNTK